VVAPARNRDQWSRLYSSIPPHVCRSKISSARSVRISHPDKATATR